jgi:hypothetical protein
MPHRPSLRGTICSIGFCELRDAGFVALAAQLIVLREKRDIDVGNGITDRLPHTRVSARNEPAKALVEFSKDPNEPVRLVGSALANFKLGHKRESDAAHAQTITNYADYSPSGVATVYAFRGESDEAFKWLDRAYMEKDALLYAMKFRTEFNGLHDDPRYKALLKRMNLRE